MTPIDQQRIKKERIKKILLIRPRRIGDIILTTPALQALKVALPEADLSYLLEAPYARLIEGNSLVSGVLTIEPRLGLPDLWRLGHRLRRQHFDVVIDFHGGPRSSLITLLSGATLRVGYRTKYRAWVYDLRVSRRSPAGPVHSAVNHLNLVRALGFDVGDDFPLCVPAARKEEVARIERLWEELALTSRKILALHINAGNRFRDWGLENLVTFLVKLSSLSEITPLLLGSVDDRPREEEIFSRTGRKIPSLVGRVNLGELIAALERVDLFVGPDSGPMHLAAALGRPIVALFGPTLPAHFAPWKARSIILEKSLACRPCRQRRCPKQGYPCIRNISADEVIAASYQLLTICTKNGRRIG